MPATVLCTCKESRVIGINQACLNYRSDETREKFETARAFEKVKPGRRIDLYLSFAAASATVLCTCKESRGIGINETRLNYKSDEMQEKFESARACEKV